MQFLSIFICLALAAPSIPAPSDSSQPADIEIARSIRTAVREADKTLLAATVLGDWRDYLKITAITLDPQLQPLLLIKFDQDVGFREQLKQLIEWESNWVRHESQHYIYYSRPDQPVPELILGIQDAHFRELTTRFSLKIEEKIPYRYDLVVDAGEVFPFDDLRAGIISNQPFDLEKAALAIFQSVNSEIPFLTRPLAKIYGSYFQNESNAEAYFTKCMQEIKSEGYVSFLEAVSADDPATFAASARSSAYAFVFKLNQRFDPPQITRFLLATRQTKSESQIIRAFYAAFGVGLIEFEGENGFRQVAVKF